MNKGELISYISEKQDCTKVEAEKIINTFCDTVISVLAEGNEINLIGFGKFYTSKVAARDGRNPQTGKPLKISAHVQAKFSAGEKLKSACNMK